MKQRLFVVWVVFVGAAFPEFGSSAGFLVVTAKSGPVFDAPVRVQLPANVALGGLALIDTRDSKPIAYQTETVGPKNSITFLTTLEQGESCTLELRARETPEPTSSKKGVSFEPQQDVLDIFVRGELFTTYRTRMGPKPYCWPIFGPTGAPITRAYPMRDDIPGEKHDHIHHRSFWFTHGRVNGHNFWAEEKTSAKTVHRDYERIVSGPVFGELVAKVDWLTNGGAKVCEDRRRIRVYATEKGQLMDFEIEIQATEEDVVFDDDKEGTFGFRVATTMDVDQGKGKPKGGTLWNANGEKDEKVWGKRATWCDYYGPVAGKTVGIAIFDDRDNYNHPTYWHARTYGLFTANPFGVSVFTANKKNNGSKKISKGEKLRFLYRCYLHEGDTESAKVAIRYANFANPPEVTVSTK